MAQPNHKILLIDANALIHRAFHALPPLTSPKGELVNAVYGFASALLRAMKDEKPDYVVVCYDAGRQTFRNDIYDGYKAHRQETAEELYLQIPRTKELVESLSIPLYAQKGVEADDLIGSLSKIAAKKGLKSVIVTGDKDVLQLVDDTTSVYSLHRGFSDTLTYDSQVVKEKIGVYPKQIVEYKALAGDASDEIPGIPGFGPKTAVDLLNKYQTIEGIYKHLDELSDRQRKLLMENKKTMEMSKKLAQIKMDLKIELNLKDADVGNFDFSKAVDFFHQLGFKSLLNRLPESNKFSQSALFAQEQTSEPETKRESLPYLLIKDATGWKEIFNKLTKQKKIVFDTETVDLHGELIGISFAWQTATGKQQLATGQPEASSQKLSAGITAAYLPLAPVQNGGVPLGQVKDDLTELFLNEEIMKIGHNLKYDIKVMKRAGFETKGNLFDTMIASTLINSQLLSQKLDSLSISELGFKKIPITDLIGRGKDKAMNEVDLEKLAEYSCEDTLVTFRLYEKFFPNLETPELKRVFYEIEMPLLPVLIQMEWDGIKIDKAHLAKMSGKLTKRIAKIEKEVHKLVGSDFNLSSPAQLKKVLFEDLKLSQIGVKKVKTGLSTDAETLIKMSKDHPIIELILEHRELSKLLSTYIDALPKLADKNDRIHTSFQQVGAITGRLSSQNPNLQNIPVRTELGTDVRRSFIADKDKLLLGADYSQVELRIVAHMSDDPKMIDAFNNKADIHKAVSELLGVDRRAAKAINFGIIYGLGPTALSNDLGISMEEARKFIDDYLKTFPGIVEYMNRMRSMARQNGYVETLFGRRRYLPDIHSPNQVLRAAAERMAINMPAQGTVADMMKLAMVEAQKQLPQSAKMLLQIHDELLWEVPIDEVDSIAQKIAPIMTEVISLKVPLTVEVKTGPNWADIK